MVNRGEMILLHSLHGLGFMFLMGLRLGLWPMYLFAFLISIYYVKLFI